MEQQEQWLTLEQGSHTDREIAELGPWFHNLHLPNGTQTAPNHLLGDFPAFKWAEIAPSLPEDLSGWTALDIGCNAGFYTFELARRGARVTGIDLNPRYLRQAQWAAEKFGVEDRVRFERMQVYDLAHTSERYDLVLFLGVFYHLRYPLLGLDIVARRVRRLMVFQTLSLFENDTYERSDDLGYNERDKLASPGWPRMSFIENRFAGDPTNWWVPNTACIEAMLRSTGMNIVGRPEREIYLCSPADADTPWWQDELRAATGQTA